VKTVKTKPTEKKGFTLVEMAIASTILLIVLEAMFSLFWTTENLYEQGKLLSDAQAIGRIGMEKLERDLRMGLTATLVSADQITYTFDTSANPDSPTLVTRSLYFSTGADGLESTSADNGLVYDPNTSVTGDEQTIMTNVRRIPGSNVFSVSGKLVTVNIRVVKINSTYNVTVNLDLTTIVRLRN